MSNRLTRRDFAIRSAGFGLALGLAPAATLADAEQASRSETSPPDADPPARSYLLHFSKLTDMGLAGRTPAQMNEVISAAIARKELPPMEPGAMCYMMSKEGYGGDSSPHWPFHLMFFYTDADLASWGANLPGSPVVGVNDPVEHLTQFVLTAPQWSDGTQAGEAAGHHH